jgi:hypothetical protein
MPKIAICTPCHGDTKALFTSSLVGMVNHSLKSNFSLHFEHLIARSSTLVRSRTDLVARAMEWGADYILWADSDHVFASDAFMRLWGRQLPVVGVNYPRREVAAWPTAVREDESGTRALVYTTKENSEANELEEVITMGFGLCLVDMKVIKALVPLLPLFSVDAKDDGQFETEDAFFFGRLRAAGISLYVDHGVSGQVGHLYETMLTNASAKPPPS